MIIIDENVDQSLIDQITFEKFEILSIRDFHPGASDREIIEIAKSLKGIVITEDKDFGELVFSFGIKNCSIILLRYRKFDLNKIQEFLISVLKNYNNSSELLFITITGKKIRIRQM